MPDDGASDGIRELLAAQGEELARLCAAVTAAEVRHRRIVELVARADKMLPQPAEPQPPIPAMAATPDAVSALCDHLEGMERRFAERGLALDPADAAFLSRVRPVLVQAGPAVAERLVDVCGFCDRLGAPLLGAVWRPVHAELRLARRLLQEALPGWRVLQTDGATPEAAALRLPVAEAVVVTTGLMDPQGTMRQAASTVLPLTESGVGTADLRLGWALVEELHSLLFQGFRKPLKDDLRHLAEVLMRADEAVTADTLRSCLNAHTRWAERGDSPAARACIERLRSGGLRAFTIASGDRFDPDLHDLKRFDRVARSGCSQPPGTVVGLRQIGLADDRGMPVQKCIAIVSA